MKLTHSAIAGITAVSCVLLAYTHSMAGALFNHALLTEYGFWANVVAVICLVAAVPATIVAPVRLSDERDTRSSERKAELGAAEHARKIELINAEVASWRERFGKK